MCYDVGRMIKTEVRNMKKRVLCLLTCLALLMSLSVTVFAEDTTQLQQLMKQSFQEDKMLDIR